MLEERYHPSFLTTVPSISRRVNKLDIKIDKRIGNDIVIALDSTGIKVANCDNLLGALDNPNRRRILKFLLQGEKSRREISDEINVSLEATTRHCDQLIS